MIVREDNFCRCSKIKKNDSKIRNYLVISLIYRTFVPEHLAVPISVHLTPCGGQKIGFEPLTD